MKLFIYCLLSFLYIFNIKISASPWYEIDDFEINRAQYKVLQNCNAKIPILNTSPISLNKIYSYINTEDANNISEECKTYLFELETLIKDRFFKKKSKFGFQTKVDELYIQDRSKRFDKEANYFYEITNVKNDFSYSFKVTRYKNETVFDGSHFSYRFNDNAVLSIGKISKWWSPSNNSSLILSNAARSFPSITLKNYKSIDIQNNLFNFLGHIDYEIFLGKLERDREIPNTLIFGNFISFQPFERLNLSLSRVAQFGGKGRSINSDTIKNMILGKDNTNTNLDFNDQPGNQIAGLGFSLSLLDAHNLNIYGQYMGEDGLDPIIDDRWVGAIFPSKRFEMAGIKYSSINSTNGWNITFEHLDTDTGFPNVTYNHGLYKSGYRYKGFPLGAAIDTDSHQSIIVFEKFFDQLSYSLKYEDMLLNQNNSLQSRWNYANAKNKQLTLKLNILHRESNKFELGFMVRNTNIPNVEKNIFFFRIEKQL